MIPTYAADGRRLRNYAAAAIARLLALDLIVVERSRKGKIRCAHFRPTGGANPIRQTAHMGQHYSFHHQVGAVRVWEHRQLIARRDLKGAGLPDDLDLFVRAIFRAVPLSVMRSSAPSRRAPALAKIISIESSRKFRSNRRPVEFDSERRAA